MRNPLWVERWRPQTIEETILPAQTKAMFQKFVADRTIPNLLLSGTPGIGKTTVAKAALEQLGCDYHVINASLERNIDTLRVDILQYVSTHSIMNPGRKYIILDEADYLNPNTFQPAFRNFTEEHADNCGFILTCNYPSKLIEPLRSRFSLVDFRISKDERPALMKEFALRVFKILDTEGVSYEKPAVTGVIKKYFPDMRRVLVELQSYAATGKIDTGILANPIEDSIATLYQMMKDKEFTAIRKWVADNSDIDATDLFAKIYALADQHVAPQSIPELVLIIAKYQYQAAFVANQEINNLASCIEMMMELTWS